MSALVLTELLVRQARGMKYHVQKPMREVKPKPSNAPFMIAHLVGPCATVSARSRDSAEEVVCAAQGTTAAMMSAPSAPIATRASSGKVVPTPPSAAPAATPAAVAAVTVVSATNRQRADFPGLRCTPKRDPGRCVRSSRKCGLRDGGEHRCDKAD